MSNSFIHVPHPRIHARRAAGPPKTEDQLPRDSAVNRFNSFVALKITQGVGTMWCAYAFAALALISLPDAIHAGTSALVSWTAQTFLQLVLLSIIIVGQNISTAAADERAQATYEDADAVLHTALQIQQHLAAQDADIAKILATIGAPPPAA